MFAAIAAPGTSPIPTPPEMHAPDGFLSVPIAVIMWAITLVVLAIAVRRTNRTLDERAVPLLGVTAAFIFAAQMVNFQVVGGTSGHLLGGVLAAVLLGPWAGTLVMACVIAVQALVFQDGGLVVMGARSSMSGRPRTTDTSIASTAAPVGRSGRRTRPPRSPRSASVSGSRSTSAT